MEILIRHWPRERYSWQKVSRILATSLYSLREIILISGVLCRTMFPGQGEKRREAQKRKRILGLRSQGHVCGLKYRVAPWDRAKLHQLLFFHSSTHAHSAIYREK